MTARRVTAKVSLRIHAAQTAESAAATVKEHIENALAGKVDGHYVEDVRAEVGAADVRDDDG